MIERIRALASEIEDEMLSFAQELVKTKSITGDERLIIELIGKKMKALGYDDVRVDGMGNLVGRVGQGGRKLLFDSHTDTVAVTDPERWSVEPFAGTVRDGMLYGRGAVDMKSAIAASVYAGAAAKRLGLSEGKTLYVSTSVMEEDYDGEALVYEFGEGGLDPDYVVICEPSSCRVSFGQKGRAMLRIDVPGRAAHGSAPEMGDNPLYKAADILKRIEALGLAFMGEKERRRSIALTGMASESASLNAIPSTCCMFVDRRLALGEGEDEIRAEMAGLLGDSGAAWRVHDVIGTSWTGRRTVLRSFLPAWEIGTDHPLAAAAAGAYRELLGHSPARYTWDFSTNGVASATKLGIPTIGFGPGDSKLAHCADERCPIADMVAAFEFYVNLAKWI
ncbi:MAG: YgeY family selenium metabolism-linked hydrolase [Rectinemataceae bacterium]